MPFITLYLIGWKIWHSYKAKKNKEQPIEKKHSKLYNYLHLIFIERVNLRPSIVTVVAYVVLFFSGLLFNASFVVNLKKEIFPPVPLEKMQISEGIVKSIVFRKKMDDLLVLETPSGKREHYAFITSKEEVEILLNNKVKFFYSKGFSSLFTIDNRIYQIVKDGKIVLPAYSYESALAYRKVTWNFVKNSFLVFLVSAFIIWFPNRKERPIHRLNRLKKYIKNKNKENSKMANALEN